ncbi:hypothetical protein RRG08_057817 [Elysia crispata]|uniref:Uncharacterized protein n=1 Tax=Elysia crispata TaxID=231223 RepID=A0AAE1B088_9GAST|nr:hypothetical protein RRG08_057817 [Elysia crispata]
MEGLVAYRLITASTCTLYPVRWDIHDTRAADTDFDRSGDQLKMLLSTLRKRLLAVMSGREARKRGRTCLIAWIVPGKVFLPVHVREESTGVDNSISTQSSVNRGQNRAAVVSIAVETQNNRFTG